MVDSDPDWKLKVQRGLTPLSRAEGSAKRRQRLKRTADHLSDSENGFVSRKRLKKFPILTPHCKGVDPFNNLTDDIITTHILSRLSLKEAVRSCVLSRRWQNMWTYNIGPNLVFSYMQDPDEENHLVGEEWARRLRLQLAYGVSLALANYNKPTLEELTVRFHFNSSSSGIIDSWVEFALRKGVSHLELDFSPWESNFGQNNYGFPSLVKLSNMHALCDNGLHQPVNCAGMSNLRVICLKFVNVSSEIIDFMLSHCPLERLSVWWSMLSEKMEVYGQSSRLKSLEVVKCSFSTITVSSSTLERLQYSGDSSKLRLHHVPCLSELSAGNEYCRTFLQTGFQNFSFISQLKKLSLDLGSKLEVGSIRYPLEFPELVNLEQLEVKMTGCYKNECLLWPIVLIKAAPLLLKFSVKLLSSAYTMQKTPEHDQYEEELRNTTKMVNHQCLKLIEMRGFTGFSNELELGQHLLGSSQPLEKFAVVPWRFEAVCRPFESRFGLERKLKKLVTLAKSMTCWVPVGTEFIVL